MSTHASDLRLAETTWRLARAHRLAFLVDAAAYYEVLEAALRSARQSVFIIGWDTHSQVRLGRRAGPDDGVELVTLLREITEARPALQVRILTWDHALLFAAERELLPLLQLGWRGGPRVDVRLDDSHPIGASQHQKVVVVDDRLAFCGGIDLTIHRWDDRAHDPDDPRRRLPDGDGYEPYHDLQAMVDGDAAAALGELARERWRAHTEECVEPVAELDGDPWPDSVRPDLRDVDIGVARTLPDYRASDEVREIEASLLAAIASARRTIYIENQYLTSAVIADALAERLCAPDGPDVLIVTPSEPEGPVERATMGALRAGFVERLRAADQHDRLRVVTPYVGDSDVYVHAKLLIVDDRYVQLGSANLADRSMGLDAECDLCVEARTDAHVDAIAALRDGLLAEHLGASPAEVRDAAERAGDPWGAVDALSSDDRGLRDLEPDPPEMTLDAGLLDPSAPIAERWVRRYLPDGTPLRARAGLPSRIAAGASVLVGVAAVGLWVHAGNPDAAELARHADGLRGSDWAVPAAIAGFALGVAALVPVSLLVIFVVVLLGPWLGAAVALAGTQLTSALGWLAGRALGRHRVRRLVGEDLERLGRGLAGRGARTIAAIRLIPFAPSPLVSLAAGSARVPLRDFLLGSALGNLPGIALLAFASDRVLAAVLDPGALTLTLAAVAVLVLGAAAWVLRRVLRGS